MTVANIHNVVVVGAGTMGPGIAATFARNGYVTTLSDVGAEQVDKARSAIDFVFSTLLEGGFVSAADVAAARGRMTLTMDPSAAIAVADFIVENVPERLDIKRSVFETLSGQARSD